MTIFYHGTTKENLDAILEEGVNGPSYWGTRNEAEPYADGVLFAVDASRFSDDLLAPNNLLIESLRDDDPVGNAEVLTEWQTCPQTWEDSLRIFGSVRYDGNIDVYDNDLDETIAVGPVP